MFFILVLFKKSYRKVDFFLAHGVCLFVSFFFLALLLPGHVPKDQANKSNIYVCIYNHYYSLYIYSIRTYKQYNSIIMLYKYSILYSQLIYAVERRVKQRQVWMGELGVVKLRCSVDSLEDVQR